MLDPWSFLEFLNIPNIHSYISTELISNIHFDLHLLIDSYMAWRCGRNSLVFLQ